MPITLYGFDSHKKTTHKINLFVNRTALDALFSFDSLKKHSCAVVLIT